MSDDLTASIEHERALSLRLIGIKDRMRAARARCDDMITAMSTDGDDDLESWEWCCSSMWCEAISPGMMAGAASDSN